MASFITLKDSSDKTRVINPEFITEIKLTNGTDDQGGVTLTTTSGDIAVSSIWWSFIKHFYSPMLSCTVTAERLNRQIADFNKSRGHGSETIPEV